MQRPPQPAGNPAQQHEPSGATAAARLRPGGSSGARPQSARPAHRPRCSACCATLFFRWACTCRPRRCMNSPRTSPPDGPSSCPAELRGCPGLLPIRGVSGRPGDSVAVRRGECRGHGWPANLMQAATRATQGGTATDNSVPPRCRRGGHSTCGSPPCPAAASIYRTRFGRRRPAVPAQAGLPPRWSFSSFITVFGPSTSRRPFSASTRSSSAPFFFASADSAFPSIG